MSVAEEQKITLPEKVQNHIIYIGHVLAMYKLYIYVVYHNLYISGCTIGTK